MNQTECAPLPAGKLSPAETDACFVLSFKGDSPLTLLWPSKDARYLWFSELQVKKECEMMRYGFLKRKIRPSFQ